MAVPNLSAPSHRIAVVGVQLRGVCSCLGPMTQVSLKTLKSAMRGHRTYSCEILRCKGAPVVYPSRLAAADFRHGAWGSIEHTGGSAMGGEVHDIVHSDRCRLGRPVAAIGMAR